MVDDAVVSGIEEMLVPLETTEPEADSADLRPLEALFDGRTIIGLGESTQAPGSSSG